MKDVDGCVVAVEQTGSSDEADFVVGGVWCGLLHGVV